MKYWGRIFFIYTQEVALESVKAQPLESHVGNCRRILEKFDEQYFCPDTRERLFRAVDLHDEGKKYTFFLKIKDSSQGTNKRGNSKKMKPQKKSSLQTEHAMIPSSQTELDPAQQELLPGPTEDEGRFTYSFSGHRFRVPQDDPYVVALIRSHHAFSVEQINREKAKVLPCDRIHLADDLYLLCMADQIEAELATKTIEDKREAPRSFMEFVTEEIETTIENKEDVSRMYRVIPWPFCENSFELAFDLCVWSGKELGINSIEKFTQKEARKIQDILKKGEGYRQEKVVITLQKG